MIIIGFVLDFINFLLSSLIDDLINFRLIEPSFFIGVPTQIKIKSLSITAVFIWFVNWNDFFNAIFNRSSSFGSKNGVTPLEIFEIFSLSESIPIT